MLLSVAEGRLRDLGVEARIEAAFECLNSLENRMARASGVALANHARRLESLGHRLEGNSLISTLGRGFSLIRDEGGKSISSKADLRQDQQVTATFADGDASLRVEG